MITAADAVIMIAVQNVFDTPQQIQQFSADNIYGTDPIQRAEVAMGVDGNLTGGFVYAPTTQRFILMADSPSVTFFDAWDAANERDRTMYVADGTTWLNSLGTKYDHYRGFLTQVQKLSDAARVLQPRTFVVTWQRVSPAIV